MSPSRQSRPKRSQPQPFPLRASTLPVQPPPSPILPFAEMNTFFFSPVRTRSKPFVPQPRQDWLQPADAKRATKNLEALKPRGGRKNTVDPAPGTPSSHFFPATLPTSGPQLAQSSWKIKATGDPEVKSNVCVESQGRQLGALSHPFFWLGGFPY